jgi:hypothetical protein
MAKFLVATVLLALASLGVAPTPGEEKPTPQPCVILKRMGPADQVTSHLYSFGIRGKQYQYVEGKFPEGMKFHGRLTDNDIRKIEGAGGKAVLVEVHYTEQDLEGARRSCTGPTATADLVTVSAKSLPDGADITVDGKFMGNTPSTLRLGAGDHVIVIQRPGFKPWQRTMTLTAGETPSINAALEPEPQQRQ